MAAGHQFLVGGADVAAFGEAALAEAGEAQIKAIGVALLVAQYGGTAPSAKPFRVKGGGVVEVVQDFDTDTYRAVYTVRFQDRIYVLHCFQKKSKTGIKTPKQDVDVIEGRLKAATADYRRRNARK